MGARLDKILSPDYGAINKASEQRKPSTKHVWLERQSRFPEREEIPGLGLGKKLLLTQRGTPGQRGTFA